MKFTVEKSSFLEALLSVQNVVPARSTLQILSNALFKAEDGVLSVCTTNLDVGIRCMVPAKIDEAGATTLPIKRLVGIVRELGDGAIDVEVDDNDTAKLRSGSSFFRIVGLAVRDFPPLPQPESKVCFTLPSEVFREMLRKTSYAVSEDESRRIITGVLLSFKDAKLTVVATDGRRLALVEHEVEFPPEIENELVLPARTVAELQRLLKDEGDVRIFVQGKQAIFQYGDTILATKLIEGTFPNYRQVIPPTFDERVEVAREDILAALRRVSVIASDDRSVPTELTFSGGELVVTMQNPEVGEARETVPIKYGGKEMKFTFNPEYVMAPLRNVETDAIFIELSDGHGPATFKCDLPFLYVLMPLRTGA